MSDCLFVAVAVLSFPADAAVLALGMFCDVLTRRSMLFCVQNLADVPPGARYILAMKVTTLVGLKLPFYLFAKDYSATYSAGTLSGLLMTRMDPVSSVSEGVDDCKCTAAAVSGVS